MRVPHPLRRLRRSAETDRPDEPITLTRAQFVRFVRVNVVIGVVFALAAGAAAAIIAYGRIRVLEDDLAQRRASRAAADRQVAAILEQYRRTICTLTRHADDPAAPDVKALATEYRCNE